MVKMALIAGAAEALKFKRTNPKASDDDALQHVNRESTTLANQLGSDI